MRRNGFAWCGFLGHGIVGLALVFPAAGALCAADIFVDNVGGDDLLDGTAADKPGGHIGRVKSIAKALRISGPGDRIQLKKNAEPYHESITLMGFWNSGMSPDQPFIIQGNG